MPSSLSTSLTMSAVESLAQTSALGRVLAFLRLAIQSLKSLRNVPSSIPSSTSISSSPAGVFISFSSSALRKPIQRSRKLRE
ncbi:hypothetical protein D3C75_1063940 [compost metagenome]